MGKDIHMYLLDGNNEIVARPFYGGYRNYEFFSQLQGEGQEDFYYYLPTESCSIDSLFNDTIQKDYYSNECYYSPTQMNLNEFISWCEKYEPWRQAGWVHKRDAWLYTKKGIYPEEYQYRLYSDDILEDMEFIEFIDNNNGFLELLDFIYKTDPYFGTHKEMLKDYKLVYFFDT